MRPSGRTLSGRQHALVFALPLLVAALAWFGWRCAAGTQPSPDPIAPARAVESAPRPVPSAAALETPESERTSAERIAGPPAELRAIPAAGTQHAPAAAAAPRGAWSYRGLVLDTDFDQPVAGATLVFENTGETVEHESFRTTSDAQGRFLTPALPEETRRLRVVPPEGYVCDEPHIELTRRRADVLVPLHRDPKTLAGAIRGELLRESGPWTAETLNKLNTVMIDIVPTSGPKWSRCADMSAEPDEHGGFRFRFEFDGLPRGEYELTLSCLAAWRWTPKSVRVSAPMEGVDFLCCDLDKSSPLVFKVSDAVTGDPIETFDVRSLQLTPSEDNGLFLHTGPLDTAAVPEQLGVRWSLSAAGYRPAFGDESAFVRRGGERVATVLLERGWATKVLVLMRDPVAKPAVRAEVWLDGRAQGLTGADGMLAIGATKAPEKLEVRYAGWKMNNDPLQPYNGKSAAQRGQVTIVLLEKESPK
jgi:hypothetical protein